jgi:hypothetical protein
LGDSLANCFSIRGFVLPLVALGLLGSSRLLAAAATDPQITVAVTQLGDGSYRTREKAQKFLMSAGDRARAAVLAAQSSADPEVAQRAQTILAYIDLGLTPDLPSELTHAVLNFHGGDLAAKREAMTRVLSSGGGATIPILAKLWANDLDPNDRHQLFNNGILPYGARHAVHSLLLDGKKEWAVTVLEMYAAAGDEGSAQDLAALCAVDGTLDAVLARWREQAPDNPAAAMVYAYLLRARGDAAGAVQAAQGTHNATMLRCLAEEAGDWKLAARPLEPRAESIEALAQLSLERRRAGDLERAQQSLNAIRTLPWKDRDVGYATDAFCFNDQPDQAIALLIEHGQRAAAFDLLCARLQYDHAFALVETARNPAAGHPAEDLSPLDLRAAREQFLLGQKEPALAKLDALTAAARDPKAHPDADRFALLIQTNRAMDRRSVASALLAAALETLPPADETQLFDAMFPGRGPDASAWWRMFRSLTPDQSAAARLKRVGAVEEGTLEPDERERLARDIDAATAATGRPDERARWLERLAGLLHAAQRDAAAWSYLDKWAAETSSPSAYRAMAEMKAASGDWPATVKYFDRAWEKEMPQTSIDAPLLWLRGWAMLHAAATMADAGAAAEQRDQASELMQLARDIPLSSQAQHCWLAQTIADHTGADHTGLDAALQADVTAELELAGRIGPFDTGTRLDLLPLLGRSRQARGDLAGAALCFERALVPGWPASGPDANIAPLTRPAAAHALRARAAAAVGDFQTAQQQAEDVLALLPGDVETLCLLAPTFDAQGHHQELSLLCQRVERTWAGVLATYPDDARAHDALARLAIVRH